MLLSGVPIAPSGLIATFASSLASNVVRPSSPKAPSDFAARAISDAAIALSWRDNAWDEAGFTIERSADPLFNDPAGITAIGSFTADARSITDSGLSPGGVYYYRISADGDSGSSDPIYVGVTTPATAALAIDDHPVLEHSSPWPNDPDSYVPENGDGDASQLVPLDLVVPPTLADGAQLTLTVDYPTRLKVWADSDMTTLLVGPTVGDTVTWIKGVGGSIPTRVYLQGLAAIMDPMAITLTAAATVPTTPPPGTTRPTSRPTTARRSPGRRCGSVPRRR